MDHDVILNKHPQVIGITVAATRLAIEHARL
jgi:hypothetical protein